MSRIDKKKLKLHDRIIDLEQFLRTSLGKKDSTSREVSVPKIMQEIAELKAQLRNA
jgi:signal transduction histidine kinase